MTDVTTYLPGLALKYIRFLRYDWCVMDAYVFEARVLKALAHPVRLRIVDILRGGEQCVCDLETTLGLRQACVSQHLMTLRRAGVVTDRKDGLRVYYHVSDSGVHAVLDTARSMVSQQARKQGLALNFAMPNKAKRCDCAR